MKKEIPDMKKGGNVRMDVLKTEKNEVLENVQEKKYTSHLIEEAIEIFKQLPKEFQMGIITTSLLGSIGLGAYALKRGYSFMIDENGVFSLVSPSVTTCMECS